MEREAVNAVRAFTEAHGCVFVEVPTADDYGKDAYIDLTDAGEVTGLCLALQIKGGPSYRRRDHYIIPVDAGHRSIWRSSNIPVIGLVYDPEDGLVRWVSLTEALRDPVLGREGAVTVPASQVLTVEVLSGDFRRIAESALPGLRAHPLVSLLSPSTDIATSAVLECLAIGRSDPHVLLVVRRLITDLAGGTLRTAIHVLSHLTPHPDIYWTADNWIPEDARRAVRATLVWGAVEIEHMLSAVGEDEWCRGQLGESVYMLLIEDPAVLQKLVSAAARLYSVGDDELAFSAVVCATQYAGHGVGEVLEALLLEHPRLAGDALFAELARTVRDFGSASFL